MVWSVRTRITALAALVLLAVLSLTGVVVTGAQRVILTDAIDDVLQRHSTEIATHIDQQLLTSMIASQGSDDAFARVEDAAGHVIASTLHEVRDVTPTLPADEKSHAQSLRSAHDRIEFRVLSERRGDLLIITATPLDDVNDNVVLLTRILLITVPSAALLLAIVVWLLIGRVLHAVEDIRLQVSEISGSNLHRRVTEPRTRDEVARLAHTMNQMLERVDASAQRQRRFAADASHELRSPLTRIRAQLEVDLAHPANADLVATHRSVLDDAGRLEELVEDLLTLAHNDGSRMSRLSVLVDLDDLILEEVGRRPQPARSAIDISAVSGAQILGDPSQLSRVIRNLLDNAVRHGGTRVVLTAGEETVAAGERHGVAVITITDDGPGIPADYRERIFERFARVDKARTPAEGGTGLGLAISREIIEGHGGTIVVDPAYSHGARFVVRLPLPPKPEAHNV